MNNHDVMARQPDHDRIEREIQEFERRGGTIQKLGPGEVTRPAHDGSYYGKNKKAGRLQFGEGDDE